MDLPKAFDKPYLWTCYVFCSYQGFKQTKIILEIQKYINVRDVTALYCDPIRCCSNIFNFYLGYKATCNNRKHWQNKEDFPGKSWYFNLLKAFGYNEKVVKSYVRNMF